MLPTTASKFTAQPTHTSRSTPRQRFAAQNTSNISVAFVTYSRTINGEPYYAAFVPELVTIFMNGLDAGAQNRLKNRGTGMTEEEATKMIQKDAVKAATFWICADDLPANPEAATKMIYTAMRKKLKAIYSELHQRNIVLPPSITKSWLEDTEINNRFTNPIDTTGIDKNSYSAHEVQFEIDNYRPSIWEQWLPWLSVCMATLMTACYMANAFLGIITVARFGLLTNFMLVAVCFGMFWYNWDDFLDRARRTGRDINRYFSEQYKATIGSFRLAQSILTLIALLVTGAVALVQAIEIYESVLASLGILASIPAIASVIAALAAITVFTGIVITLGYSLTSYFGYAIRRPQFKIVDTQLEVLARDPELKQDLFDTVECSQVQYTQFWAYANSLKDSVLLFSNSYEYQMYSQRQKKEAHHQQQEAPLSPKTLATTFHQYFFPS